MFTDRWIICEKGHVHWGAAGGAGLLFRYSPHVDEDQYLLQLRSQSLDRGGTWGIPGGAMRDGESPEATARREAEEEMGPLPPYRVTRIDSQECGGGWSFYIVSADVDYPFPAFCVRETDATGWFTRKEIRGLSLHSEFRRWMERVMP
jgi:8-oxo-dGTP pyrophosphatase MutT (NUDIX family)